VNTYANFSFPCFTFHFDNEPTHGRRYSKKKFYVLRRFEFFAVACGGSAGAGGVSPNLGTRLNGKS